MFFTSDIHFGHKNILFHQSNRRNLLYKEYGESNLDNMHKYIIKKWNNKISASDTTYVLGDMSCCGFGGENKENFIQFVNSLNGKKVLVIGNHDVNILKYPELIELFEEVTNYKEIKIDYQRIILSHFPILHWNGCSRGSYMLHGHLHGKKDIVISLLNGYKIMDIGVDTNSMIPYSFEEIHKKLKNKRDYQH